jgi:uncharacterized protein (TIGR02145 family)
VRHTLLAPGQIRGPAGAGYQDSCRMLRRVTQPPHIAGPLAFIRHVFFLFFHNFDTIPNFMIMNKTIALVIFALIPVTLLSQNQGQTQQLQRSALVIGNGNYLSSTLANPENDARAIAAVLKNLGFVVYKYENLNQSQMKKAIDDFGLHLKGFDVGLFFYAGHGIQAFGYNYLIPVDAQLTTERQVEYDCVQADRILALMEGSGTKVNIIILDACRNNPFERSWTRSSAGRGLAFMSAPGGTLIAYSTAPGTTAQDGSSNNSPYTTAFLESLQVTGLSVTQMFQNVTKLVSQRTDKQQIPWISSSLTGDFYLNTTTDSIPGALTIQNQIQPFIEVKPSENPGESFLIDPIENRRYKTIKIGSQIWMAENLRATKFNDGSSIPLATGRETWINLKSPGYCWYINQIENGNTYGALYNWYVVETGKICPKGWHVPADWEWSTLSDYLGGFEVAGGKLKEASITHWNGPNTGATNETGFTALPGGYRNYFGEFDLDGNYGYWWSSTESYADYAWYRYMYYNNSNIVRGNLGKQNGFSVRCVRD